MGTVGWGMTAHHDGEVPLRTRHHGGLTHSEDSNVPVPEGPDSLTHVILGLAVHHQEHNGGRLGTQPSLWLQIVVQQLSQGQA